MNMPKLPIARMILGAVIILSIGFGIKELTTHDIVLIGKEKREVIEYCKGKYTYDVCKEAMDKGIENQTSTIYDLLKSAPK